MDLSSPSPTTNSPLIPVFGDNVQDLLGTGVLKNPSAIITVNSIADTVDDTSSGVITLRDAINQANADNGQDLIVFDRSLFSNQQTITLSGTELDITHNLDIIAPRDPLTGGDSVTVSGNKTSRVFEIEFGSTVSIDGLIVADGNVKNDNGGGIKNSGTLIVDSSIVRDSSAFQGVFNNVAIGGRGGGIYNNGNLVVSNSTLSGNSSTGTYSDGGGIDNSSTLTISNSTLSGNSAYIGGGILNAGIMTMNNSTISGNSVNLNGGGILNGGTMTMSNSTIIGNSGTVDGGGIYTNGTLDVSNSTISGNSAGGGGGISNFGRTTVRNSTLSNNSAGVGGGIFNLYGSILSRNSTFSGNSASFGGGGIYNYYNSRLTLVSSTLTLNQAPDGSGVYNYPGDPSSDYLRPGTANVRNTIIAANLNSTNGINPDVSGPFTSNGYNLIGDSTGSTGFDATGDIVGTSDNPIDPRLAPLDNNGGPTQTLALLPDSSAIDAADPTVLDTDPTTDQRGLPRISGSRADIGAFEVQV